MFCYITTKSGKVVQFEDFHIFMCIILSYSLTYDFANIFMFLKIIQEFIFDNSKYLMLNS